jgi:hypothetical protein
LAKTDSLPWGIGLASATAASYKNTKILASQVLNLVRGANESVNSKSRQEDKGLVEDLEGESQDGTQFRYGMEAPQQLVYTKGSVASVFANVVSMERRSGHDFVEDFSIAIADIFYRDETPDLVVLTTALERNTSEGQAYLVIMNDFIGFTLMHNLQCVNRKNFPGDPIIGKVVAFRGVVHPRDATPNVFIFDKEELNLFVQVHLLPRLSYKPLKIRLISWQ